MALPSVVITGLLVTDRLTIGGLVLLAFLGGILQAFTTPAISALIPHTVPTAEVPAAIAMNNVLQNACRFVGAALVGAVITAYGTSAAFVLNSGSLLVAAVPWWLARVVVPPRVPSGESFLTQLAGGLRFARDEPAVGHLLILNTVIGLLIVNGPLLPIVTSDLLDAGPSVYGLLQSVTGIGAVVGAVFAGRAATGSGRTRALSIALLATAVSVVGVGASSWVALSVVVQIVFGFGMFTFTTCTMTIITLATPDKYLGRVMSLNGMTIGGMVPINALIAGSIANVIGTRQTLLLAGLAMGAYVTWFTERTYAGDADAAPVEATGDAHVTLSREPI
jgi:MFS family permease